MAGEDKGISPVGPNDLADDAKSEATEQLTKPEEPKAAEPLAKPEEPKAGALGLPNEDELDLETLRDATSKARRRRIITIAALALAVIAGGAAYFFFTSQSNKPAAIDPFEIPAVVRRDTFRDSVSGTGKTSPSDSGVISPEVSGIIENLSVTVGQEVNEGDVLFTLRNDALDDEVRKAQEAVDTAQRALDSAWNKVTSSERSRDAAYRARDVAWRARDEAWNRANESGDWSTYDDNQLTNAIDTATESIDSANIAVGEAYIAKDGAEAELSSKRADLETAQKKAAKRTVTAPMSGSVIAVNAENGQSVGGAEGGTSAASGGGSSSSPLVQIANGSQMKIKVQINEVDIESISVGQTASVTFQAIPDLTLESTVQSIADVATNASSSSGSGSDSSGGIVTYAVDLMVDNSDSRIKPGMTASVTIITQQIDDVLIVPLASVFGMDEGNPHVLRITDAEEKQYESVPVEVTARSMAEAVISGEVSEGDQLLTMDPDASSADAGAGAGGLADAAAM